MMSDLVTWLAFTAMARVGEWGLVVADQVKFSFFISQILFVNGFSLFKVGRQGCLANKNCDKLHCIPLD